MIENSLKMVKNFVCTRNTFFIKQREALNDHYYDIIDLLFIQLWFNLNVTFCQIIPITNSDD